MKMDISIIMPVYNAERFVREAIEGVLTQHFTGTFELLIADDQSADGTAAILTEYATTYPDTVKVFNNLQNLGCSANSISLARRAKGKYLAFCDADDIWIDPMKLQKQFDFLEQEPSYDMVCTNANRIDEAGNVISKAICASGDLDVEINKLIRQHTDVYNSSVMMRADFYRTMLKDCAWFEHHECFFDTIWAWYATKNSHLRYMDDPMIAFRELQVSDSHTNDEQKAKRIEKRYYMMKMAFVLSQDFSEEERMSILLDEYDYIMDEAYKAGMYAGELKVRSSKAYHIGKKILTLFKKK